MPRVLAIAAHPDDIEFSMAGALLLLKQVGHEPHVMNLANGCCGSTERSAAQTAAAREREARAAADLLGAVFHPSVVNDLEIFYEDRLLRRVAAVVREVSPEIVLTHSPVDYMEDHTNACRLAVTAAFVRGMPNYQTDPPCPPVDAPVTVYHAQPHGNRDPLGELVRPHCYLDIASVFAEKTRLLACHASQQHWLDQSQGMSSMALAMREQAQELGRMSGRLTLAEGWRKHLHLGFCPAEADPLATALAAFVQRAS
jgi:LmbE family N-acetylglucosaminyl deacetylase